MDYFSNAHMCFSVAGDSGQNHKTADLSLKINFFQIFRSIFGFLVKFYPYPEIKKYAEGQELLIFAVFLKNCPTVALDGKKVHCVHYSESKTLTKSRSL